MDDELTPARDQIRKALKQAKDSNPQISEVYDFTELVKNYYLAPMVYKKHMGIVFEMWNERNNAPPPTPPADSNIRSSPDSEASDVPLDNSDHLPVLDPETSPDTLFIMAQTHNPKFAYASYRQCSTPGSYIRADAVRNNKLEAREDGLVEVQWKLTGERGISDDHRIPHTACRVVNEEDPKSMNMDVDVILGMDCRKELKLQAFVAEVCRARERPASVMEGEAHPALTMPAADGSWSTQMPCTAWSEAPPAPTSLIHSNFGPIIVLPGISDAGALSGLWEATCHPATTRHAADGASGTAGFGPPVVTALNGPKTSEGSQTKRKTTDEHELRSRDRPRRFGD